MLDQYSLGLLVTFPFYKFRKHFKPLVFSGDKTETLSSNGLIYLQSSSKKDSFGALKSTTYFSINCGLLFACNHVCKVSNYG